jgi:hypothetical protein
LRLEGHVRAKRVASRWCVRENGRSTTAGVSGCADLYNRQLHPSEEQKLKELQRDKTPEEQYRLAAAECALVHCAAGVPDSDPNKAVLQKMQDDGQGYMKEQNLLKQAGAFEGSGWLEALNDGLDRYQVSNRAVGAVQGVTGAVAAGVVLGGSCATVAACLAGAAVAGTSLDYSKAGFTQLLNGDVALTYGEQALQSLGLSPQAAAIAYAGLSIGAVVGSVTANSKTSKVVTSNNAGFDTSNLESKLDGYLLDAAHPQNQSKANWFSQALGFNQSNWKDLAAQLYFDPATAVATKTTQYGQTYEQVISIVGANGKTINTTFVFMKDNSGAVRLVTGIPAKQ